ncbi:imidazole glycerol phosphate synthase subunit HisH [bacterium]|nr:imidazole glycerol phosphate synthase subunit HisH [bacterium]
MSRIAIVDYQAGNLRSVARALERLSADYFVASSATEIARADAVILPGQGAFRDCVANLTDRGVDVAIRDAIREGKPYLGICIGLQVLFDESEEFGKTRGLGVLPGRVTRFSGDPFEGTPPRLKVPHMGWTRVRPVGHHPLFTGIEEGSYFYFVHSYFAHPSEPTDILALAEHGHAFAAAAGRGRVMAVQFHPEKSQEPGRILLENFLRIANGELECS